MNTIIISLLRKNPSLTHMMTNGGLEFMFVPGLQRSSRTAETSPSTITYGTAVFGLFLETMRVLDAR